MKYSKIHCYKSVRYKGAVGGPTEVLFFDSNIDALKDIKLEDAVWGVRVTSPTDDIIVSYANISAAYPLKELVRPAKDEKSKS